MYIEIYKLNSSIVDTHKVFLELDSLNYIYENQFLVDLSKFLLTMNSISKIFILGVYYLDNNLSENYYFAKAIDQVMSSDEAKSLQDSVLFYYQKIKLPPTKYASCVKEIENSYRSFNELINTLNNLQNYSRFTLRQQLAKLDNSISSSINNLAIYLPKDN